MCDSNPINGKIRVEWNFTHTGGRPLTLILITYVFRKGNVDVTSNGPYVNVEDRTADIPSLVAGIRYTAMVNATNPAGSVVVECPPVDLEAGIPEVPQVPEVEELGGGRVRVTVQTLAAGLEPSGGDFSFILTQMQTDADTQMTTSTDISIPANNYESGDNVEFDLDDLTVGDTYTFSVRATNSFGTSGSSATSSPITVTSSSMYYYVHHVLLWYAVWKLSILYVIATPHAISGPILQWNP